MFKSTTKYDEEGDVIMENKCIDNDGDIEMKNMNSVSFNEILTIVEYKLTDYERLQKQKAYHKVKNNAKRYRKQKVKRKKYQRNY